MKRKIPFREFNMPTTVRAMAPLDSGLEIRDRMWLKITMQNAFIGVDVVHWLYKHVKGFHKRQDAKDYASLILKSGLIKQSLNKPKFSSYCFYTFVDSGSSTSDNMPTIVRAMSRPDSDLEIRERVWLEVPVPSAFLCANLTQTRRRVTRHQVRLIHN
ncbi:hypothetical protein QAD02_018843 [Eretmocerus hayati]|uniref:Uncharacterized protein n=1 Tax=Eretmocerus hayati TaxID=131215 RepID=A0ACC2PJP2_9HYME|nr:hypothetical protein QAD02_018843 [Eretmocerus hayati]